MDQTTSSSEGILWRNIECRKVSNLDRDMHLCIDCNHSEAIDAKCVSLRNSTGFNNQPIRENPTYKPVFVV